MSNKNESKLKWECEGCKTRFAEYVNGCPRCWDDNLSSEKNRKKYPNRKVVKREKEINGTK